MISSVGKIVSSLRRLIFNPNWLMSNLLIISLSKFFYWQDKFSPKSLNLQIWLSNVGMCILNIQTWLSNFGNRIAIPQQVFSPAAKHDKKCLVSTLALVNYGEGTSLSVVFGSQTTSADGNTWVYNQNFFKI